MSTRTEPPKAARGGARTVFNQGRAGRWRECFNEADLAAYQARVAAEFTPDLAAFLEGGRQFAGGPRPCF